MPRVAEPTKLLKAQRLSKAVVENGGNLSKAAKDLGMAKQSVQKQVQKPLVQSLLQQAMVTAGITTELIAKRLKEGLSAQDTKFFQMYGKVRDTRRVVDMEQRRKYAELALKIRGDLSDGDKDKTPPPIPLFGDVNVTVLGDLDFGKILKQYTAGVSGQRG